MNIHTGQKPYKWKTANVDLLIEESRICMKDKKKRCMNDKKVLNKKS